MLFKSIKFKIQSAYQSAFHRFPFRLLEYGLNVFSPALFYQAFQSCDINFILLGKVWKLIRFSFFHFFFSFFLLSFLHSDTAHCTMRHSKHLYYACSVTSTGKTVMHTKLNRFTAETYTRDGEKMHDNLYVGI